MFGYPKKIEYWMCSDGQIVDSEERAREIEAFLDKERDNPTAFSSSNNSHTII